MNRRNSLITAFSVLFALSLTGCATTAPLDAQAKSEIRKVAIGRTVSLPERPKIISDKAGGAFLLAGNIGLAAEQNATSLPDQFIAVLATHRIDVREMLRAKLQTQLTAKGFVVVAEETQADAVLDVNIVTYGLTGDILFGGGMRFPLLGVGVQLVRRNADKPIWKNGIASNIENEINKQLASRPIQDYFSDGELMRREYDKISELVAQQLIQPL